MFRTIFLSLVLTGCAGVCARTISVTPTETPQLFEVVRVIDGDTYVVRMPDDEVERVRLRVVDTPEVYPKSKTEPFGPEASAYARELLTGRYVRLEIGVPARDVHGRLLARVELADKRDVAVLLLQAGLGELRLEFLDVHNPLVYAAAMQGAYSVRKGLWQGSPGRFRDLSCPSFRYQEEAQAFFEGASTPERRDPHRLDGDGDGRVCVRLPLHPLPLPVLPTRAPEAQS